jgi:transcriptional regulator with XRE-family HTH domain
MTPTAAFIKGLREQAQLNQEQMAVRLGMTRPTYARIEAGKQSMSLDEATKFASTIGIGVEEVVAGAVANIAKYKHMILAILRAGGGRDGKVPKTKLAKLLYLADFAYFYEHLVSMSGMQYRKLPYGPVPDAYFRALDELEGEGKVAMERKEHAEGFAQLVHEVPANAREPLSLEPREKKLIGAICEKWQNKKTQDIVNFTHNQLPYSICRTNEIIPYVLITQEDAEAVY